MSAALSGQTMALRCPASRASIISLMRVRTCLSLRPTASASCSISRVTFGSFLKQYRAPSKCR